MRPADVGPRGWRFVHPDFAAEGAATGLRIRAGRGVEMVEGDASVRQAVLLLLSTTPGERVMRPESAARYSGSCSRRTTTPRRAW